MRSASKQTGHPQRDVDPSWSISLFRADRWVNRRRRHVVELESCLLRPPRATLRGRAPSNPCSTGSPEVKLAWESMTWLRFNDVFECIAMTFGAMQRTRSRGTTLQREGVAGISHWRIEIRESMKKHHGGTSMDHTFDNSKKQIYTNINATKP